MNSGWAEIYLGLIFQVYGLAFFVLGVAAFGMLHGLQARQGLCSRRPATASGSVTVTGAC